MKKLKHFLELWLNLESYSFFAKKFENVLINLGIKPPLRVNKYILKMFTQEGLKDQLIKKGYETSFKYILQIKELSEQSGAKLLVVIIPSKYQVEDDSWDYFKRTYQFESRYIRDLPNKVLSSFLNTNEIEFVDLLGQFSESDGQLYYPVDRHFNRNGHNLTAKILLNYLGFESELNRN